MATTTTLPQHIATWLEHIRVLSVDIGARPATREGERKGAEYAQAQFERIGLRPIWESFLSARSIFFPHVFSSILLLTAFVVYPLGGIITAVLAALLSWITIISEYQELGLQDNIYRRIIPKYESQNVHAIIEPAGEYKQDLVLVGHLDTQRTPFIFRSATHVRIYNQLVGLFFVTFIAQTLLYTLAIFFNWNWVWYATIPSAISALLLGAICIEADTTPFTAGANDNATAAGIVLALAEHYARQPLQHTRILAVCTGCEEVEHDGIVDFYKRYRHHLKHPKAIVFEMLGCAGPAWILQEGIVVPFKADPQLINILERIAQAHPEWSAYGTTLSGGNSEMSDCVRAKVPAVTLFGLAHNGEAPYWHQVGDTFDKMNPEVMGRTWLLTTALIQEIDQ